MSIIDNLEKMLASGRDSTLLRYSLGNEYAKLGRNTQAIEHLRQAVKKDPGYSAAWKQLGKSLAVMGKHLEAIDTFDQGITNAEMKGDVQAIKEMEVFWRRSEKALEAG